ncbi:MAG: sulfite exporter TauE/SafE family protein [Zoogloea sp.]|nr:sulfite exporter TauE/SafE family protein [Zoogloea sp.]
MPFADLQLPFLDGSAGLLLAAAILLPTYAIFSLAGFGSGLLASAPLGHCLPASRIVPLLALLDCAGASQRAWKARAAIDPQALARLLPGMLLGQVAGVVLLRSLPTSSLAALIGAFVTLQGLWQALRRPPRDTTPALPAWCYGSFGGILGGLFGSGGFAYAAYLQRALPDRQAFRATQAVLVGLSTLWRVALCVVSGLIDLPLLAAAALLLPLTWLGMRLGDLLDGKLPATGLFRLIIGLQILAGLSLLLRVAG